MPRLAALVLTGLWIVAVTAAIAGADDFRIETKVFAGKSKTPVSENKTLFQGGYVYDYLSDPERTAVFDKPHGRFILLDPVRKIKAEVKIEDVQLFVDSYHARAAKSSNAFTKFAADPVFETTFSEDGKLVLASSHLTYRLATEPASTPEAAAQYREFCDWYARFNAMSNPGSTPPFPRLVVDAELAERGLVPSEVQLTIPAQSTLGVFGGSVRSEHRVSWRLLQRDLKMIAETANQLATFKRVDFDEFQPATASKR